MGHRRPRLTAPDAPGIGRRTGERRDELRLPDHLVPERTGHVGADSPGRHGISPSSRRFRWLPEILAASGAVGLEVGAGEER